jgi:hypothetical protein
MIPVKGNITTDFIERRPLSKPLEERDHIHGAIDIRADINTEILAPEGGTMFAWCAFRTKPGDVWPQMPVINDKPMPFCNYFYDTFGGVIVIWSGARTHVITHSYGNQIFNKKMFQSNRYYEEKADARFPLHAFYTDLCEVNEGAHIGYVGNAGFSSGPHVHYEIHKGHTWNRWEDRINPEEWVKG